MADDLADENTLSLVLLLEDCNQKFLRYVQHWNFRKKLRVNFLSKFKNPASITLGTNVLKISTRHTAAHNTNVYKSFAGLNKLLP